MSFRMRKAFVRYDMIATPTLTRVYRYFSLISYLDLLKVGIRRQHAPRRLHIVTQSKVYMG